MTEIQELPPLAFIHYLSDLLGAKGYLDNGVFLGVMSGLNIIGTNMQAGRDGNAGSLYVNVDKDLTYVLSVLSIVGAYAPSTASYVPLESSAYTADIGTMSYTDATARIDFGTTAEYLFRGSITAQYSTGANSNCRYTINIYDAGGGLSSSFGSGTFLPARNGVRTRAYSIVNKIATITAGQYAIITLGSEGGSTPLTVNVNLTVQEIYKYD